jgi:hypothetical protein
VIVPILIFVWIILQAPQISKWLKLNHGFEQNAIDLKGLKMA